MIRKSIAALVAAFLFPILSFSQDDVYGAGSIPFNDRGAVVFSQVIKQDAPAPVLYSRIKAALSDLFVSFKDVLQLDDPDSGVMVVKGINKIENVVISYTVKTEVKDGRFRAQVYDIVYTAHLTGGLPDTVWAAEDLTDSECLNKKGVCKKIGKGYARRCVIDTASWLLAELEARTSVLSAPSGDDNW